MAGKVKLAAIGGFLGSGKTTLMINLGEKLASERGKKIAVITNDQGEVLVDTKTVKDFGFAYAEVLRGCFCCRFPEFITSVHEMLAEARPDVILAEPVGSCTDLLATVYAPLRRYYDSEISLAPYIVLVDASTVLEFDEEFGVMSPRASQGYLYSWQLQEAEVVAINKVDLVSEERLAKVEDLVRKVNEAAEVVRISAKTGHNLGKLANIVLTKEHTPRRCLEINYEIYGAAEAALGWLNGSFKLISDTAIELGAFVRDLMIETAEAVHREGGEIVHLKVNFSTKKGAAKASLVTLEQGVDFLGKVPPPDKEASILVNARARINPDVLLRCVEDSVKNVASKYDAKYSEWLASSFSPTFPRPYYRLPKT